MEDWFHNPRPPRWRPHTPWGWTMLSLFILAVVLLAW
jgi:hypothetical protein